jgi:hypothetical protein
LEDDAGAILIVQPDAGSPDFIGPNGNVRDGLIGTCEVATLDRFVLG